MKKNYNLILLLAFLIPALGFGQSTPKVWYDGNSRAMFYRDALSGNLKDQDTTSTRSEGEGYTAIDIGMHFTPNNEIEIFSEIRIKNDFGFMWGSGSSVDLRRLSIKGILDERISFNIGDLYLRQTDFTLNNNRQELAKYEPSVFQAYRDLIEYENFYYQNYWRMQGVQSNLSYSFYNSIKSLELDGFLSRVRGGEWLGQPELLMLGGTSVLKLENSLSFKLNHINSFEVQSSSLDSATYYNPVTNLQISYRKKINDLDYKLSVEAGASTRGWESTTSFEHPKITGSFIKGVLKIRSSSLTSHISLNYVDPNFRSAGAQTRRVEYNSAPSTYAYYTNNTVLRPVSLLDITTDPNIYNQRLSTSLMNYNPLYSAVSPYGESTPNRNGLRYSFSYDNSKTIQAKGDFGFFNEVIGQGTLEKRSFFVGGANVFVKIDELLNLKNKTTAELSFNSENVKRGGSELESINFNSSLISAGASYELFKNLKLIAGLKSFFGKGNEVGTERNDYDEIIGYDLYNYDSQESIMLIGLQYNFTNDIYFSLQTNKIEITDKINEVNRLSLSRVYFMFNMNL